jgi:hypothetical protein
VGTVLGSDGTFEVGAEGVALGTEGVALGDSAVGPEGADDDEGCGVTVSTATFRHVRGAADALPDDETAILRQACGAASPSSLEHPVTAIPASAVATKIARLRRISRRASSSSASIPANVPAFESASLRAERLDGPRSARAEPSAASCVSLG